VLRRCDFAERQIVLHAEGEICLDSRELLRSSVFQRVVSTYCEHLRDHGSSLIEPFLSEAPGRRWKNVTQLLVMLATSPIDEIAGFFPQWNWLSDSGCRAALHAFVEGLYNYWRSYDRYLVLHTEPGTSSFDRRPYRAFNITVENLTHVIRAVYRDICENITGDHPRIYRQVHAGCKVGLIALSGESTLPEPYASALGGIPLIRQAWLAPPLIIDPPMNKRTGEFERVPENPVAGMKLNADEWLCFPAQVGPVLVFVYFHQRFLSLGCSLANLFELADDEQIQRRPDAIYVYGAPPEHMRKYGELPTVFYDDEENHLLAGAVPGEDRFGYFGYLKKMILTLHNVAMMKRGRMPFHGAMTHVSLKNGAGANILMIGDTATGKSELLEAFRALGAEHIRELDIVADDMGSLEVGADGRVLAYGTETGAFVRLDDLQQGYVFQQVDRAIIMSPQKVNARVVVPVTTLENVLRPHPLDLLLYANNYENVDADCPVLERFLTAEQALTVFRRGAAMAKGTTTSSGLVHSYFANIFGAPQYREMHEELAQRVFAAAAASGMYVGQVRTRLGIQGWETEGPREAARALFALMTESPLRERASE
jgi:hypothetical protein